MFSWVAGVLLLLVIPLAAVWVFGNAVISGRLSSTASDAGHGFAANDALVRQQQRAASLLNVALLFLLLVICVLIKELNPWDRFATASVRYKLLGLLLYAVALPLSGLLYFGTKYLGDYRELLTEKAFIACHGSITDLENGFEKAKAGILKQFRSYPALPGFLSNPASLKELFKDLERKRIQKWIEVRDINCEILMTTQDSDVTAKLGVICKAIGRLGINRFLSHRLDASKPQKLQAFEVLIQEFFESPLGGWARVFESPDELHRVSFGGFDIFFYWNIFDDPTSAPAFMIADQEARAAIRRYISDSLKRRQSLGNEMLRMLAWSTQYSDFLPAEPAESDIIKDFVTRVKKANAPQSTELVWQGARWLAAGAPGKTLSGTFLLSFYPVEAIDRQIARVRADLLWAALFAVLLAALVGMLFARTLISPVASLMLGVQALRRRDTGQRLTIMQNDELGRLSATFNATSEALEDVLSAKKIQGLLIPDQMPQIEGFSGDLFNQTAADLGGDYCDVLPLDEKRWLLVIGDVTGHGVSSALVTAMTKAIVCEYARAPEISLNEMFVCLNELLFSQFKRKKCLTIFAAILDTNDNSLTCINAGHPLPLLFSVSGLREFPKKGCPPLGFSAGRQEFPQAKMSLAAGECLIMFTDILIETRDNTGNPLGSRGFAAICSRYLALPPNEMRAGILAEVTALAGNQLEDDLTMIILKNTGR